MERELWKVVYPRLKRVARRFHQKYVHHQPWRIAADGWRNPQSGRCLTAVAAGLAITDCTGAANQRFSLT